MFLVFTETNNSSHGGQNLEIRSHDLKHMVKGDSTPPPCFFWDVCAQVSKIEKAGRSVCTQCAVALAGIEYPLRAPSLQPLYLTGRMAAGALDMLDE